MSMAKSRSAANFFEAIVIGSGVVGLACARALAKLGKEVLIVERESKIGSGTSSRNSEVVHGGLYYPRHSKKAELCVKGRNLLYRYCEERSIGHKKIGKLVVAKNSYQYETNLRTLKDMGEKNGVENLKLLQGDVVKDMEPNVECFGALYSPETGIVDSHSFMLSLLGDAENHGAIISYNTTVDCPTYEDEISNDDENEFLSIQSDGIKLSCDILINCAGLFSDRIAKAVFLSKKKSVKCNVNTTSRRQYFAKGNYFRLEGQKPPFQHLIYPVPEVGGLGIHATIDLQGQCRFGPDVEWISPDIENPEHIELVVNSQRADIFYEQIRIYWPDLKDGALIPDYAGLRPKLRHPDLVESYNDKDNLDFLVQGKNDHGVSGFINLLGIESPGLTSSLALAETAIDLLYRENKI